jgi:cell filamentation protein
LAKAGFSWPPACLVEKNMRDFERNVLAVKTPCRPGPLDRTVLDIAQVHADMLLIHPCREGNGRLARWLSELMALQSGLPLPAYRFTGRGPKRMGNATCTRGRHGAAWFFAA